MINFKKGPALSLHQVNYIGKAKASEGVVAGMVVQLNSSGEVVKASVTNDPADKALILGFAINNQDSGDVIESNAIGIYALDGASVIETDQVSGDINTTNFPVGSLLSATAGQVVKVTTGFAGKVIGQVEGIRTIPGVVETISGVKVQGSKTVLGVKLLS